MQAEHCLPPFWTWKLSLLRLDQSSYHGWLQKFPVSVLHTNSPNLSDPKNMHSGERFQKYAVSVWGFTSFVWTGAGFVWKRMRFQECSDSCGRGFKPLWRAVSNEAVLVTGFTKELKQLRQRRQQQRQKIIGFKTKTTTLQVITLFSEIQLVVYYQCCVLIGWATTRLYVIAH